MTTAISNGESGSSVRSKLNDIWAKLELNEIDTSIADTAVDVFVYDTSKDSDGGAWRKRTQGTSWYQETLNTATRGSRREFPAVAVIVAESDKVTIYDGDDPALPMWMVFNAVNNNLYPAAGFLGSMFAINGVICAGNTSYGCHRTNFISDTSKLYRTSNAFLWVGSYNGSIVSRNAASGFTPNLLPSEFLVSDNINDVAMTVLPDAPIDPATGLPVPTIAVATDGGISVITDSGAVYDLTASGLSNANDAAFFGQYLYVTFGTSSPITGNAMYIDVSTITGDITNFNTTDYLLGHVFGFNNTAYWPAFINNRSRGAALLDKTYLARGHDAGVTHMRFGEMPSIYSQDSMVAYTTSTYNTGWMNGDIKGAFLSSTDTASLVGGTDDDRSVNGNDLTVNGTITRSAVATGAELVAYSGFSASNYLEQPYNADLDFGTGDFCIMGWVRFNGSSAETLIRRQDTAESGARFGVDVNPALKIRFLSGTTTVDGTTSVNTNTWVFFAAVRSSGVSSVYVNGASETSSASTDNVTNTSAVLKVGLRASGTVPLANGSLALFRISATAPTAEQIARIYQDERPLFQENAACTIAGTSDAVTALAFDDSTQMLHVGTSAGRSVFQGLRRVDNTTSAVTTAISAQNGLVIEQ